MSTIWHKMSDLKPVCSIKMWKLTEKSYFCALSVHFWGWCAFLSWKISFKTMLSGKTQWRLMSTFWHKMSGRGLVISNVYGDIDRKIIFLCPLRSFLRLVCIFKLEDLLQDYVKWKNTMTFNVNFLTQNVGPWTCYKQCIWGYWPKNHIFVPFTLHFWGWCAF